MWRIEWQDNPVGRAERYGCEARAADIADGRASRVEWTAADGVRVYTQALVTSYARQMARDLEANHGHGENHYADVAVVPVVAS